MSTQKLSDAECKELADSLGILESGLDMWSHGFPCPECQGPCYSVLGSSETVAAVAEFNLEVFGTVAGGNNPHSMTRPSLAMCDDPSCQWSTFMEAGAFIL